MKILHCAVVLGLVQQVQASVGGIRNNSPGRKLQLQLVGYGGEPPANRFPLQLCEGDCDNDDQVRYEGGSLLIRGVLFGLCFFLLCFS